MAKNVIKRMLDAGMQFSEMSQATAERVVSELVKLGQVKRRDAESTIQALVDRGRDVSERAATALQTEFLTQLGRLAQRLDDIEDRVEEVGSMLADVVTRRTSAKEPAAAATAPAKKAPAKKTAARKAPAKKTAAKKTAATKAPAKKAPAKRTAAKKAAPTPAPAASSADAAADTTTS